jgi:hypothetical protein
LGAARSWVIGSSELVTLSPFSSKSIADCRMGTIFVVVLAAKPAEGNRGARFGGRRNRDVNRISDEADYDKAR